jgi:hypothetical protein
MKQPTLLSDRLQLLPASIHHLDVLWAVWRDEDVRRVLFNGDVGLLVYSAGTPARDPSRDLIEPLAAMLPAARGCGYANEALAALRAYAQRIGRAHSLVGNGRVHHDQAAAAEGLIS